MEKQKNNMGIIVFLVMIVVVLSVLCVLFATDTISLGTSKLDDNNQINENNKNDTENNNQDVTDNNDLKYANQISASVKTDNYNLGKNNGKTIDIKLDNGNIVFTSDEKELVLSNVNAKYIYLHQYMDSSSTKLYYISENNELYRMSLFPLIFDYTFDKEKLNIDKVTDSKVTDFLGNGNSYSREEDMSIDTTYNNIYYLLEDGSIESLVINYYKNNG